MIKIFHGEDAFSAGEALDLLRREIDTDGTLADTTTRIDGRSADPGELLSVCQTMPLLGGARLVVVEGLLTKFEPARAPRGRKTPRRRPPPAKKKSEDATADGGPLGKWQPVVEALPSLPESTTLVFLDSKLSAANPLLKALTPLAEAREFLKPKPAGLAPWLRERAELYGAELDGRAVAVLADLVGDSLATLDSELRKLATYADGKPISEADVRTLVSQARDPNIFAMADAVVEGRSRDAVDLVRRLLADSESPQRLLTMIARQYRLLILTKGLVEQGVRPPQIASRVRVPPFAIQRLQQQAARYSSDQLRRAYAMLLEADLHIKRGVFDDETALQLLLAELAALARPPTRGRPATARA